MKPKKYNPDKGEIVHHINELRKTRDREADHKDKKDSEMTVTFTRNVPPTEEGGEWTREEATYTLEELIKLNK